MSVDRTARARQVTLGIQSDKRAQEYIAVAEAAEALGFDGISVFGDLMHQPPIGPLLLMAGASRTLRLGAAGYNPFTVHPVEIAGQLAVLDDASDQRAYFGLVRGAWLDAIGIDQSNAFTALTEALEVVQRLLRGDDSGFEGQRFRLAPGMKLFTPPVRAEVPVLIGTWGPKTAAWAGTVAHEVKIGGSTNPAMVPVMKGWIGNPDVGVVLGAVTVCDHDRASARRRARTEVAIFLDVVAPLDPTAHVDPELLARLKPLVAQRAYEEAGALIPDDVLDLFAFSGTPDDIGDQAERLFEAGASRVEFGPPQGSTTAAGIELIGRHVLPRFR